MASTVAAWPTVALGEILTERNETPPADALVKGKIPIVAKVSFDEGRIHLRDGVNTKTEMILVRPGDLLVSGINAAKGAIALYHADNRNPVAATIHYGAYSIDKARADARFLWWLLRSDVFRGTLADTVPGGIKTELKASRLLRVPVSLPPLYEQERIAATIEVLAAQIAEAKSHRRQSTAQADYLMSAAIGHEMAQFIELGKFADIVTFKPRSGPSFPTDISWNGLPVLMPSSVTGFGVDITKVEFGPGNEHVSPKDVLEPGDILIARGNKREQVGNAGVVPSQAAGWVCANLLMRLKVDIGRSDPAFCIYWFRSPRIRDLIKLQMTGTNPNIQKINQRTILSLPYPVQASLALQRRITASLNDIQERADALKQAQLETAVELDALLPSLLDQALRGEL